MIKNVQYKEKSGKVMALLREKNKVYVAIGATKEHAMSNLVNVIDENKFALYDMDAFTSAHNSSVRTRV
jgi:hypothetical protein